MQGVEGRKNLWRLKEELDLREDHSPREMLGRLELFR